MLLLFIVLQVILLAFMMLHDWIDFPPFTDLEALKQHHSVKDRLIVACINSVLVIIPLWITICAQGNFSYVQVITVFVFYLLLTIGTICAWWIPYIFGSSAAHKQGFIEYKNTHTLLPARGDNVVPNTLHIVLHLLVWSCFGVAVYYLVNVLSV